jgi:hemerythrin
MKWLKQKIFNFLRPLFESWLKEHVQIEVRKLIDQREDERRKIQDLRSYVTHLGQTKF